MEMLDGIVRETVKARPRAPEREFGQPRRQKLQTGPYGEKIPLSGPKSEFFNTISPHRTFEIGADNQLILNESDAWVGTNDTP